MASNGRDAGGERDKPKIGEVITQTGDPSDAPKEICGAITCAHPSPQVRGSDMPQIANTITKTGPNK